MKTILDYADLVKEQHALNTTIAPVETDLTSASQDYAVGQKFVYDGVLYQAKAPIAQGAALVLNTNYEAADDVSSEIEALTKGLEDEAATRSVLGAKNILPFDLADIKALNTNGTWAGNVYSYRGVDFTVNADGTVTANGTATGGNASIKLYNASANYEMLGKKVILNGCPSGGSATTYRIQAYRMGSADGSTGTYFDDGEGTIAFDALNNASGTVGSFAVAVYENATVTNLLFKPMVRLATDSDGTYQPYAKTNRELTAENQTLTNNVKARAELSAYNLLNIFNSEINTSGTYTEVINDDGTVTIGGTPTTSGCTIPYRATTKYNGNVYNLKPNTDYVLDSGLSAISPLYLQVFVKENSSSSWTMIAETAVNTKLLFTTPASFYDIWVRIIAPVGVVVPADTIVKPMIILASDIIIGFVPYAMTNRELTFKKTFNIVSGITEIFNAQECILDFNNANLGNVTDTWATVCTVSEAPPHAINGFIIHNSYIFIVFIGTSGNVQMKTQDGNTHEANGVTTQFIYTLI